jgi:adenylate cyclase
MRLSAPDVRDALRSLLAGLVAALAIVGITVIGWMEPLEHWALSQLFELRGARAPRAPIVIVTIDESSIAELGNWPFPRALTGHVIRNIAAGRPLAIGIDVIFEGPSARGPDDDRVLGESVALAGNVVLGAAATVDVQDFYTRESLNVPSPGVRGGAAAIAPVNLVTDPDGYVRRVPLALRVADEEVTTFDVALYRLAREAGLAAAPLPTAQSVLINFRGGPKTFPWVPYYRVLNGEIPPAVFRDSIVLLGPTTEVLHDVFATPFARSGGMPGVEIHANVLETYLLGNAIREAPAWMPAALAGLAGVLGSALVVRLHPVRGLAAALGIWVAGAGSSVAVFAIEDVWVRVMSSSVALVLGYGATTVEQYVREQREKRRLSQFFSPDVLTHVVREQDAMKSSRRLVTVLFSDIRGFTSISEKLEPEQVAEMLQEYLTEMTEVVFRHNGTVDKYIGDCIMALYNVPFEDPDHAANAIRTGLEFQERLIAVSRRWEEKVGLKIRNGVGINTGEAVVGTLGSRQRLEYTAIGDTINLGSRLESITKDYGVSIIISEFTHDLVRNQFLMRQLGAVTVKGKTRPVKIYAVLPHDLRKHARAIVDTAATMIAADADTECVVTLHDVSEGGLAVRGLPETWEQGKRVAIRCEGGALPKPLAAAGGIVWRRGDVAGIAFATLDADTAAAVQEFVARDPARRRRE